MESETLSEKEDPTMSVKADEDTSRSHQKEDIFGKYEDKDYGIKDDSNTDYIDEDDDDQHCSRKKASMILGKFLLLELIDDYKTLSIKMDNIQ